jgi:methionine-rich copper-binding protein CopC
VSRPGLVALALLLTGAAGAGAHAFLDRADPRAGRTVKVAPAQVRIWFTESLEPAFSSLRVVNEAGRRVDKGDSQVDPTNLRLLRVSLPPLPPGTYKVIWRVLSVDSHVTEGDFTFRVAP